MAKYVGYPISRSSRTSVIRRPASRRSSAKKISFARRSSTRRRVSTRRRTSTKTRTLLKRKLKTHKVKHDGPVTESMVIYQQKVKKTFPDKFMKRIAGKQTLEGALPGTLSWNLNNQAAAAIPWFGTTDVNTMCTEAGLLMSNAANSNYGVQVSSNWNLYMDTMAGSILITNQGNDPIKVMLYDCIARKDINNANYYDPELAWNQGSTDQGGVSTVTFPGAHPFQATAFGKLFKCVRIHDIHIQTGGHHIHKTYFTPKHIFNNEEKQELGTSTATYGGLSCFTLMVAHGFPVDSNDTTVGLAAGKLDYVALRSYQYEVYQNSTSQIFSLNNLGNPTNKIFISDLTGQTVSSLVV